MQIVSGIIICFVDNNNGMTDSYLLTKISATNLDHRMSDCDFGVVET